MPPAPRRWPPLPELAGPLPVASLALLALNDHLLKARWPGPVTGKLSDLAGCFALPLVLSAALALLTRWRLAARLALGAVATTVLFAAIKLSPSAAGAVAGALSALARPLGLAESRIVADPTDLVALPLAALAVWHGLRAGAGRSPRLRPPPGSLALAGRTALLGLAFLTLTATSMRPTCPPESGLVGGPVELWAETDCGPPGPVVLRLSPETCHGSLEGGPAVGLPEGASASWSRRSLRLYTPAEPAEAWVGLPSCEVRLEQGASWPVTCDLHRGGPLPAPPRVPGQCAGTLRRVPVDRPPPAGAAPPPS